MLNNHIFNTICKNLGFAPTAGQEEVLQKLAAFIIDRDDTRIFVISGFAGTGKTSVIAALVSTLNELKIKSILLAPTGRAAKVLSNYSHAPAYTIHKRIYRQKSVDDAFGKFDIDRNINVNSFFIVDEVSMVSNSYSAQSAFGSGRLLDDLVDYVRGGKNCRLILVGDRAQLPPVGLSESPALNERELSRYGEIEKINMNDVVRQSANSGILSNANKIRYNIDNDIAKIPPLSVSGFNDVELISAAEVVEKIDDAYGKYGRENTIIICYSNKRANKFNLGIRAQIFGREEMLVCGDSLMVVKNCYQFIGENAEIPFIANGDIAEIVHIGKYENRYGFNFANVSLCFHDYNDIEIDCKIMLDTLTLDAPALSYERQRELYAAVAQDYDHITDKRKRYKAIREDLYFNALQVKYAYAVTCHKSQGGQWSAVFLDKIFIKDENLTVADLRWLYTAFTRATKKLYLIDFDEKYLDKTDCKKDE